MRVPDLSKANARFGGATINSNLYNQTSADEFVKQALSSASASNQFELPLEVQLQLQLQNLPGLNSQQFYPYPENRDKIGDSNKNFYGEVVRERRNVPLPEPQKDIDNSKLDESTISSDKNLVQQANHLEEVNENLNFQTYSVNEDLNLCDDNNQFAGETNKDETDEYLASPTSTSSISSCNSHRTYFPRGIINPNYPGFQHLAHTLSEHFVSNITSDSYESDMSDDEMELSEDSYSKLSHYHDMEILNGNNNNSKDDLNETFADGDEHSENLHQFQNENEPESIYSDANHNSDVHTAELHDDLPENLKTVLTFLEPTTCTISTEDTESDDDIVSSPELQCTTGIHNTFNVYQMIPEPSVTPDILQKNHKHLKEPLLKKEHRPDLLRGVSPHHMNSNDKTHCYKSDDINKRDNAISTMEQPEHQIKIKRTNTDAGKEDAPFGTTPVDIIGDFEQEVEREFGLLVSGYRRLSDGRMAEIDDGVIGIVEKLDDAMLSNAKEEIGSNQFFTVSNTQEQQQVKQQSQLDNESTLQRWEAKDLPAIKVSDAELDSNRLHAGQMDTKAEDSAAEMDNEKRASSQHKPKYQKSSYDERQLPPVAIEYKSLRSNRKHQHGQNDEKSTKHGNGKVSRHSSKSNLGNRSKSGAIHGPSSSFKNSKSECNLNRRREEAEIHQYQQLISDKESILNNSRYAKMSAWAEYLKNSCTERKNSVDLVSPSTLELFDAYKIGTEIDMETLQKHLKMAKEIEKKRRSDREEIRRRLAMGIDDIEKENWEDLNRKKSVQFKMHNGINFCLANDPSSDTESHSSDSETCPKLSKVKPHHVEPTTSYTGRSISSNIDETTNQVEYEDYNNFFTKQARLQIEARTALAQAKMCANMQMKIERQHQRIPPITRVIRGALERIGIQIAADKRHITRQMLTEINIAQLQILVNSMHSHIHDLNEVLMNFLMERDDLNLKQDGMLNKIESLTRFICAKEHSAHQN